MLREFISVDFLHYVLCVFGMSINYCLNTLKKRVAMRSALGSVVEPF